MRERDVQRDRGMGDKEDSKMSTFNSTASNIQVINAKLFQLYLMFEIFMFKKTKKKKKDTKNLDQFFAVGTSL